LQRQLSQNKVIVRYSDAMHTLVTINEQTINLRFHVKLILLKTSYQSKPKVSLSFLLLSARFQSKCIECCVNFLYTKQDATFSTRFNMTAT